MYLWRTNTNNNDATTTTIIIIIAFLYLLSLFLLGDNVTLPPAGTATAQRPVELYMINLLFPIWELPFLCAYACARRDENITMGTKKDT